MGETLLILIGTGLASNLILDYMLGTDAVVAVSQKTEPTINLGILMLLVMPVVTLSAYLLHTYLLAPLDLYHLQLISLVLLSVLITVTVGNLCKRFKPAMYERIALFIPLVTVNSALLGIALITINSDYGLTGAFLSGLGTALGFGLVALAIAAIREKVSVSDVPVPFQGVAILMITLGLISMAFMGFSGISNF